MTRIYSIFFAALCLAVLTVYYWLGTTSLLGLSNDDVVFMVLAKSLAAGLGYRELYLAGEPWHVGWPPLYPAFLAFILILFPDFWDFAWAAKALNVGCAVLAVLLSYVLARRRYGFPLWQAGWVAAAVALGTFHATMIDLTMADVLFSACLLFSLFFLEKAPSWSHTWWSALGVGGLLALPAWGRSAGLALSVAAMFWLWHRCSMRFWLACAGTGLLFYLPWPLYVKLAPHWGPASWNYGMVLQGYGTGTEVLPRFFGVLFQNLGRVVFEFAHMTLVPLWTHHSLAFHFTGTTAALLVSAMAWGLVATGMWRMAQSPPPLLLYFLPVYLAVICVYPWDPSRYLLAISAPLSIPFVRGVAWLWDAISPRFIKWRWQRLAVTLWLGFWFVGSLGGGIRILSFLKKPAHHDALLADWQEAGVRDGMSVAEWLKWNTPRDAVVMSSRPPLTYLQTGRQLANCSAALTQADRAYLRQHEVYAVLTGGPEFQVHTYEFYQAHPDKFELKFKAPEGSLRVYRVSQNW